jgi:hypothetical protein
MPIWTAPCRGVPCRGAEGRPASAKNFLIFSAAPFVRILQITTKVKTVQHIAVNLADAEPCLSRGAAFCASCGSLERARA